MYFLLGGRECGLLKWAMTEKKKFTFKNVSNRVRKSIEGACQALARSWDVTKNILSRELDLKHESSSFVNINW